MLIFVGGQADVNSFPEIFAPVFEKLLINQGSLKNFMHFPWLARAAPRSSPTAWPVRRGFEVQNLPSKRLML
jgi:hypothetical protein